jgi:2-polyprenyl-3-methyl-5-hydroxy-6-metoxy-1,4-benzoquinol methylase
MLSGSEATSHERSYELIDSRREDRVYANAGNQPLLQLLRDPVQDVLDVGCGAGDNARAIKSRFPECRVCGITISNTEADVARRTLDEVLVRDLESGFPPELAQRRFDTIIFSHVLEHLREPAVLLRAAADLLKPGGQILIAVPNVLGWRQRVRFVRGDFTYESAGVLDSTHLRFFTYFTADKFLLPTEAPLRVTDKTVAGGVPLWILRRHVLPRTASERIDEIGCRVFPNLFGDQILLRLTNG